MREMHELQSFIDKNFKQNKKKKLESLITPLKHGQTIPKGTLAIMASSDATLRLKLLNKDTPHKGFSTPLVINDESRKLGITENYLHWYLGQEQVQTNLMKHATGSVILRVPRKYVYSLPVPVPVRPVKHNIGQEVVISKPDDPFRNSVNAFYEDYLLNIQHQRYRTAAILAGAVCEALLYQLLLEEGVDKKLMDGDRSLGLGKLLTYLKLLKLDKSLSLPMTHLTDVQKKRNGAVHFGSLKNKPIEFEATDLESFNQVIKYFGI